jgi:hypothetical protein
MSHGSQAVAVNRYSYNVRALSIKNPNFLFKIFTDKLTTYKACLLKALPSAVSTPRPAPFAALERVLRDSMWVPWLIFLYRPKPATFQSGFQPGDHKPARAKSGGCGGWGDESRLVIRHEFTDEEGRVSRRVVVLSCCHVLVVQPPHLRAIPSRRLSSHLPDFAPADFLYSQGSYPPREVAHFRRYKIKKIRYGTCARSRQTRSRAGRNAGSGVQAAEGSPLKETGATNLEAVYRQWRGVL